MAGYPQFFKVNDGNSILKHPLYLKYNVQKLTSIDTASLKSDLGQIMATNENMGIIWYMSNLLDAKGRIA